MLRRFRFTLLAAAIVAAACTRDHPADEAAQPPAAPAAAGEVPSTGGRVYEVRIVSARGAPSFQPSLVAARRGDVIRFVLADGGAGTGVSFPREGNPAGAPLPSPSPLMRHPGQVYEVPINLPTGTYTFASLPPGPGAAAGTLTVSD
ncbi:MAG TPA: hypothetical protein VEQ60_28140 [Longimicrobium sp.]|nr:hypothetical protein [Longimicrobium sp.]